MDSHSHDDSQHEHRIVYLHVWPFNFAYLDDGEGVVALEDGLWGWLDNLLCRFGTENGMFKLHTKRHPWWVPFGH